jgi:hypothetical protein
MANREFFIRGAKILLWPSIDLRNESSIHCGARHG